MWLVAIILYNKDLDLANIFLLLGELLSFPLV
jgi:hypothetical protein